MAEKPLSYDQPNIGPRTGPDRIIHVRIHDGEFFHRRGGKFVERLNTGQYALGTAATSNLAGFLESEQMPLMGPGGGRDDGISTTSNQTLPVNFGLEASAHLPCSGRVAAVADIGGDFNLVTGGVAATHTLRQFIDMGAGPAAGGVVRISQIADLVGSVVACTIPPARRLGNL
jgi:hypothetical protein